MAGGYGSFLGCHLRHGVKVEVGRSWLADHLIDQAAHLRHGVSVEVWQIMASGYGLRLCRVKWYERLF